MNPLKCSSFLVVCLLPALVLGQGDDFMGSVRQASMELEGPQKIAGKMLLDGDLAGSSNYLLNAFPEPGRTLPQAFVLGNVLFEAAPEISYELHKKVARELSNEPYAQLEWALQQHRKKEYAGAAEAYAVVTNAMPERAVFHGMQAECLIQIGKIEEAVAAWQRSEDAQDGTLIDFESMVCEINGGFTPLRKRCLLRERVVSGEVDAAEELILHDANFATDWWNSRVNTTFLEEDLELIRHMKVDDAKAVDGIVRAGIIILAAEKGSDAAKAALIENKLLLDEENTLPTRARIMSHLLGIVESQKLMTTAEMRDIWEEKITQRAVSEKSAVLFNAVAVLNLGTDRLTEIQDLAWQTTGGEVFAVARIAGLDANDKLCVDNELLKDARAKFPLNGVLAECYLRSVIHAEQLPKEALTQAIKAEYSHLSSGPGLYVRRSARKLRVYFHLLAQELEKEKNKR